MGHQRCFADIVRQGWVIAAVTLGQPLAAQGPPPDTARARPAVADSARLRRPVTLPTVRTEATRVERRLFEEKPNVGVVSISRRELAGAPRFFAEPDLLRTMQLMPGVEARNDYSAGMNVRGGEADQNLILLDGYPIYNPFHFGGLFGTFIDPAVARIDLFTGAFPAQYGGRLSSVLDVRSAEETRRGVHGTSEVSLIASTLALGGALGGSRASWSIAGRRTYADRVVDLVKKRGFPYHFTDGHAHLSVALPAGVRLATTAYDGDDRLHYESANPGERQLISWGNQVLGATLSKDLVAPHIGALWLGDSLVAEQRVSRSRFGLDVDLSGGGFALGSRVDDTRLGGALTSYGARTTTSIGYELASQRLSYSTSYPLPLLPAESLSQRMHTASGFVDELWRVSPSLLLEGGARLDVLRAPRKTLLLPRLSAKYFVTPDLALSAGIGDYAQWIRSLAREDIPLRALDYWVGSDSSSPVSVARHYVLGVERWLTPVRSVRLEGFYKRYRDLLEPNPFADSHVAGDEFRPVRGSSYGADLLLRQFEGERFTGWVAYTYVLSTRVEAGGLRFFPSQDRRHDLNLVGSWRFAHYIVGARFNLATGTPYTHLEGNFDRRGYDPLHHFITEGQEPTVQFIVGPRNGERLPLTQRLDVSVTKRGKLGRTTITPYLSIMNVYNAPNIFGYAFDYGKLPPTKIELPQLPIFPTFGLSIEW